ncbi:MAG: ubiquinol-cytochrome c reductase iron-sulfur subunit [Acidobacteria bacterium]|nr:ubiquinol-cytochrome c reductase iron-sulfur subunit [Acidobacteriota bacterium]
MESENQTKDEKREPGCAESSSMTGAHGRRSFLGVLMSVGTVGVGAALSVPLARFALHPTLAKTTETAWSDVGAEDEFSTIAEPAKRLINIEQRDGWRKVVSEKSVYVTKSADGRLRVLSSVCPHLGCTVAWNETKGQFISPCHNGVFAPDGALISGPPRRGLDELETKIEDGRLKVRYQYFRQLVATKEVIA